mmetsp:Transcript_97011/g.274091  ORF Transcript_97011/g.274091 Transcript_97011/m.274091 type:complete len:204 (-) Transcript_97011:417-1028(-)
MYFMRSVPVGWGSLPEPLSLLPAAPPLVSAGGAAPLHAAAPPDAAAAPRPLPLEEPEPLDVPDPVFLRPPLATGVGSSSQPSFAVSGRVAVDSAAEDSALACVLEAEGSVDSAAFVLGVASAASLPPPAASAALAFGGRPRLFGPAAWPPPQAAAFLFSGAASWRPSRAVASPCSGTSASPEGVGLVNASAPPEAPRVWPPSA